MVKQLTITKKEVITTGYIMKGTSLEIVSHHPYLGLDFTNDLSWNRHIDTITKKGKSVLGVLRRNLTKGTPQHVRETAYSSMVRPHLEYNSTVWDPSQDYQVKKMEAIQNNAARFVTNRYGRDESVTKMKKELNWPSLQERRFVARQSMIYKSIHHQTAFTMPSYVQQSERSRHPHAFCIIRANCDIYRFSFLPRTIYGWNRIPSDTIKAASLDTFKLMFWKDISDGRIIVKSPHTTVYSDSLWVSTINIAY